MNYKWQFIFNLTPGWLIRTRCTWANWLYVWLYVQAMTEAMGDPVLIIDEAQND